MDSLAERITLLRSVRFFASAPETALPAVAEVLEPVRLAPEQTLFYKGDVGDSMYVIVTGRVRVHDGDLVYNELDPGHVVGEMAVLDSEPRSASVTAIEPSVLLCLHQEPLYSLMGSHIGVARGIIQILTRNLRDRVTDLASDYHYISQMRKVAAAAQALNEGTYKPESIAEVACREDALGQLARTFQQMAEEVIARERSLRRTVKELRIEIDRTLQQHQVAEITESEYFRNLRQRVDSLRASFSDDDDDDPAHTGRTKQ